MKLIMRIQLKIISLQIWFLKNEVENGFSSHSKMLRLQRKKFIKSILTTLLKQY